MSAPNKHGLDYFPHDVDMSNDQRIEYVEAECGIVGYAIYCKLLEKIYRVGYFVKWDERDSKLFAKHNNIEVNVCINGVNVCINEGLFSKKLYNDYAILTSRSIQKRYIEANNRRKEIKLFKQYSLLDHEKLVNVYNNLIIVDINKVNVNINHVIAVQSKVKESKRKKKEYVQKFDQFYSLYPRKEAKKAAQKAWNKLEITDELFNKIMDALKCDIKSKNWNKDGGQFIPLPATWLNGERWNDSHEKIVTQKDKEMAEHEAFMAKYRKGPQYEN